MQTTLICLIKQNSKRARRLFIMDDYWANFRFEVGMLGFELTLLLGCGGEEHVGSGVVFAAHQSPHTDILLLSVYRRGVQKRPAGTGPGE